MRDRGLRWVCFCAGIRCTVLIVSILGLVEFVNISYTSTCSITGTQLSNYSTCLYCNTAQY